jgi:VWFA-related protein
MARTTAGFACLVIAAVAVGQAPTFHISSRLIQVSVVVHDKKGEPVTGLTRDQFTLFDQGKPQRIAFFSEQPAQAAAIVGTNRAGKLVFSNRPEETGVTPRNVTVVLFDSLNTSFEDSGFARAHVAKFLHAVKPDDRIALYALSSRLVVLHDFTDDSDALVRALARFNGADTSETAATKFKESNVGSLFDGPINDMNQQVSDLYMGARVQKTAAALEAIAKHLAGIPGRKNLVWVSSSFPISIGYFQKRLAGTKPDRQAFGDEVDASGRALSSGDIAIYPVDAAGLKTLGGAYNAATAPNVGVFSLGRANRTAPPPSSPNIDTMQALADATGGRVFMNTNDIEGAVRTAIDDSRGAYVLAYYPDHDQWDGKFREIKVQVKQPGVETRYRHGYAAFPDVPLDSKRPALTAVDALRGPIESTELGLSMEIEPQGASQTTADGGRQIKAHLRFDTAGMMFEQRDGRWVDEIDVLWVQLDAAGQLVLSNGQTLNLKLSQETYRSAGEKGIQMSATQTIEKATSQIRFLARDRGTGAMGLLKIPMSSAFPQRN